MIKKVSYIIDYKMLILENRLNRLREHKAERTAAVDLARESLRASENELNVACRGLVRKRCVVAVELQELYDETSRLRQSIDQLRLLETELEKEQRQADENCSAATRRLLGLRHKADFLHDQCAAVTRKARRRLALTD